MKAFGDSQTFIGERSANDRAANTLDERVLSAGKRFDFHAFAGKVKY
jgi:hypothetical protein